MGRPRKNPTTPQNNTLENSENLKSNEISPHSEYDMHYFAASKIYIESMNSQPTAKAYTKEQIEKALRNPSKSYEALQHMSNYLYYISPTYQNVIDHFSTIMTFDYIPTPLEFTENKTTMMNRLISATKKAKQSQVKSNYSKMVERTLINGETYWYTLTDKNNTIYIEIPSKYCEVFEIDDNNLYRYKIKLNLLNDNIVKSMPKEIKDAYEKYKNDNDNKKGKPNNQDSIYDYGKYQVSENGFAILSHGLLNIHDYPYFSSMFIDILMLENNKEYFDSYIKDDNVKMVHNKIPTDDAGKPLMPKEIIQSYHDSDKKHVPKNVSVSTTPFEKDSISFDSSTSTQFNIVEQSKNNVQDDSGISSLVFNNEKASSNALKDSIQADANRMYPLLKFFNAILSYQLKEFKFSATFLEINKFNREDFMKEARNNLQYGGNRLLFIATSGMEVFDFLQISKLEQIIEIDDLMPVMISGSQQSGDNLGGRPNAIKPKDSTEKVNEYK